MADLNLGHVTAYGYAKSKGYTGTEEEFAQTMLELSDAIDTAQEAAEDAEGFADDASASATEASNSATAANNSATTASEKVDAATTLLSEVTNVTNQRFEQRVDVTGGGLDSYTFNPTGYTYVTGDRFEVFVDGVKMPEDEYENTGAVLLFDNTVPDESVLEIICYRNTTFSTDTSLTLSGIAADSKATGDAISELRDDLAQFGMFYITWEQGRFNSSGVPIDSTIQIRSKEKLAVSPGDKIYCIVDNNIRANYYFYTSANVFVESKTNMVSGDIITVAATVAYFRVSIRYLDNSDMSPSYGINTIFLRTTSAFTKVGNCLLTLRDTNAVLIPANTDYNDLTTYGSYITIYENISGYVNKPVSEPHFLYVYQIGSLTQVQVAVAATGMYYRNKRNSSTPWSNWLNITPDPTDPVRDLGVFATSWEQGRFNSSGTPIDSTNNIRSGQIDLTGVTTVLALAPPEALIAYYFWNDTTFLSYKADNKSGDYVTVPNTATIMRVTVRINGSSASDNLPVSYGNSVSLYNGVSAFGTLYKSTLPLPFNSPMLTIIDDDSYARFYTDLYPVMSAKNVPVASAVITGRVGTTANYMTWAQIQECLEGGMEMLSHSNRHYLSTDDDFDTLTVDEISRDYLKAKNILGVHGVNEDVLVFSGSTGRDSRFNTAAKRTYRGGFLAGAATTGASVAETINHQGGDPYKIQRFSVNNESTYHCDLDVLKGLLDTLLAEGGWMVWMTHTSGNSTAWVPGTGEGTSAYILGQAVDYAKTLGIPVVTAEYGFRKYYLNE